MARPAEYTASSPTPWLMLPRVAAMVRMPPSTGPMHAACAARSTSDAGLFRLIRRPRGFFAAGPVVWLMSRADHPCAAATWRMGAAQGAFEGNLR